jgi:regulator of ribonuclease activity A
MARWIWLSKKRRKWRTCKTAAHRINRPPPGGLFLGAAARVMLVLERLTTTGGGTMSFQTTDLCDEHDDLLATGQLRVLQPIFRHFGGRRSFAGPITTLKLFEDNSLVRQTLEKPGYGRVLVIDGGGSLRCALVGDQLAELAVRNTWAGILVFGCIRDSRAIAALDLGVMALATHPQKSVKRNTGELAIPVSFAGTRIGTDEWLYADEDGVLISDTQLG